MFIFSVWIKSYPRAARFLSLLLAIFLLFIAGGASGFPLDLKMLADTFLLHGSAVHKSVLSAA
jgi:hypothetical protein